MLLELSMPKSKKTSNFSAHTKAFLSVDGFRTIDNDRAWEEDLNNGLGESMNKIEPDNSIMFGSFAQNCMFFQAFPQL